MSRTRRRSLSFAIAAGAILTACVETDSPSTSPDDIATDTTLPARERLSVAVAFFPIEDMVRSVGGDAVEIIRLVEPGMPAHDAELTASQLKALSEADVVFYFGENFQPAVESVIAQLPARVTKVDLYSVEGVAHLATDGKDADHSGDDHDHGDEDPHIWLDPANMDAMARTVAATLAELASDSRETIESSTLGYTADLAALGDEIDAAFASCMSRTLVTAHDAFGYLAHRADLSTASITGVNPQDQPSAKELEVIADAARSARVETVFFENALPADLSRTVADAIGASVDVLDTVESVSRDALDAGATYSSIMRDNVTKIARGLGCS
ncbi:MAG: metal ABC transporter substrate-binding protein [Ilumatobacteraceae bacterium]